MKRFLTALTSSPLFLMAGVVIGCTFQYPETWLNFFGGWITALIITFECYRKDKVTAGLAQFGFVSTALGFYWLPDTLSFFGGFPFIVSLCLFFLFCLVGCIQFVVVGILFQRLKRTFVEKFYLALPLSWFVGEFLVPRMFPWALSHTQITWSGFSSLAEISGTFFLSAILVWFSCIGVKIYRKEKTAFVLVLPAALLVAFGYIRNQAIDVHVKKSPSINVSLIQGNLAAKTKGNVKFLKSNLETYQKLSKQAVDEGAELLFWPESVFANWVPGEIRGTAGTRYDAAPGLVTPLFYGAISYEKRAKEEYQSLLDDSFGEPSKEYKEFLEHKRYNSVFYRDKNAELAGKYHKKILMPFGEYLPLARKFPWIKSLSPYSGDFDEGKIETPISAEIKDKGSYNVMPLICYEDLIPSLSIEAVKNGTHILANFTNDAWYGDTAAPHQHHLLALWRAIETRRYFIRATNTGLTGVVDPFGKTIGKLDIFTEGYLNVEVRPLGVESIYSKIGNSLNYLLSLITILLAFLVPKKAE